MRGASLALVLIVSFVLGCVAAPLIVPPVRADQTTVQKWEYTCQLVDCRGRTASKKLTRALNEFGAQGWEYVGGAETTCMPCFKRPL